MKASLSSSAPLRRVVPSPSVSTHHDVTVVDVYQSKASGKIEDVLVSDPHRWLERPFDVSRSVIPQQLKTISDWVTGQNQRFFDAMKPREAVVNYFEKRLLALFDRKETQEPFQIGSLGTLQWRKDGIDDTNKLYVTPKPQPGDRHPKPYVLLDTAKVAQTLGRGDTLEILNVKFSPDGKHAAVQTREYGHGSDWVRVAIFDVQKREFLPERLEGLKSMVPFWIDNSRLLYMDLDVAADKRDLNAPDSQERTRIHKIGKPQSNDAIIFAQDSEPWVRASYSHEGRYLVRTRTDIRTGQVRLDLGVYDEKLLTEGKISFQPFRTYDDETNALGFLGNTDEYLFQTHHGEIISVDIKNASGSERTVIPAVPGQELEGVDFGGDFILANYESDLKNHLVLYNLDGTVRRQIWVENFGLPGGRIQNASYNPEKQLVTLTLDSILAPPAKYELNLKTDQAKVIKPSSYTFDPSLYSVERTSYPSKDGTDIPMWIVKSKNAPESPAPTWMYGYGGFHVDVAKDAFLRPEFIPFLEAGGTLALPVLRGGAELGEGWHQEGKTAHKQNVFDDFIAAAEYLRNQGIASKLAIQGGSNGGLLTGATMVQRPDLFDAVIDHAGVNDMLRFDEFSGGNWWVSEYGNPHNPEDFDNLRRYSPLHHPKSGNYPPLLVTTGQHDARVDPSHSYKFAAEMQHHERPAAPVYLYAHPTSAHGMDPRPRSMARQMALIFGGFMMGTLGMTPPGPKATPAPTTSSV